MLKRSGTAGMVRTFALLGAFFVTAISAHATHFRGASLTWKRLASPANTIELTVIESWRTNASGLGQIPYVWGDGTAGFNTAGAVTISTNADFTVSRKVFTHTYASQGPYTISGTSCCRISTLINAADANETVQSVVDLRGGNQGPPVITSPVILQMVQGGVNTVPLGFADVDGDTATFRMSTFAESQIPTVATAGGQTLAVSANGVLTWNTSGTMVGQLYAVQVMATDNHPLGGGLIGQSRVPFDFVIQIVNGTLNRPPVASGNAGPFVAAIGVPFTNLITGTDVDGGNLTVTHQGLPPGGTLSPASGSTGAQPLAATFSWTPTLADAGSSVGVTIVFTDPTGLQANRSFAISVPANQAPIANAGPNQAVFDTDSAHVPTVVTLNGSASFDPEGIPLTYAWTQTGGTPVALANPGSPNPSFTAPPLAVHPSGAPIPLQLTFHLDVSDGKSTRGADVIVTVTHQNLAPTAAAIAPQTAPELTTVILDGSASTDHDADPLTYSWTQIAGTPILINQAGPNSPWASFSHVIPTPHTDLGESLTFTLTVSDGIDSSTSQPVTVFVQNVNQAPTASINAAHPVFDNEGPVALDGVGADPDGDSFTMLWRQIAGPPVTLSDTTEAEPTFLPPAVSPADGSVTLTFELVTNDAAFSGDSDALDSVPATVDVLVKHANRAPIADAGPNKDVPEQATVILDGSGSYDPDQDPITYAWTQTGGSAVGLDLSDPAHPTFTSPNVGPSGETLTFELVVTDDPVAPSNVPTPAHGSHSHDEGEEEESSGGLSSAPSTVVISVKYINQPPLAVAEPVPAHDEGSGVTLDGSQSSDPDGNAFTYFWTQVGGPAVVGLSDATAAVPTFTAPAVDRFGATVVFELITTDEFGAVSDVATTSTVINNVNQTPVADAGMLQSVSEDTAVGLSGLGLDQDNEELAFLTYAWLQIAGPPVTLVGANTPTPSFHAPTVTGGGDPSAKVTLQFQLTVTDPNNASGTASTTVTVANVDHAPIANAGGITIASEATGVSLSGTASSDPDGDTLGFLWVQTSGPTVVLLDANTANPSFTAPFVNAAGATLKFQLSVTDGWGGASSDTATVTVVNSNDPPTLSNPQASIGTLWPPDHRMVKVSILGIVDPNNNSMITINSVTQDEPTNGLGDGDTAIDAIVNSDGTVALRSERSGKGNGRVYHIHFTASDFESQATGASVSGMVKLTVPHSKKDTAIDGGELFDSTH